MYRVGAVRKSGGPDFVLDTPTYTSRPYPNPASPGFLFDRRSRLLWVESGHRLLAMRGARVNKCLANPRLNVGQSVG